MHGPRCSAACGVFQTRDQARTSRVGKHILTHRAARCTGLVALQRVKSSRSGIKLASPTLASRFLSTAPLGKPEDTASIVEFSLAPSTVAVYSESRMFGTGGFMLYFKNELLPASWKLWVHDPHMSLMTAILGWSLMS